jgi:hypothetical protein
MAFTCPICGMTSHNPNDEKYRYCGSCHLFMDDVELFFDIDKLREAFREGKRPVHLKWSETKQ